MTASLGDVIRPGGIVCPLVTPLTDDERLDAEALAKLIERLVPHLDGVFTLGSSGELPVLRDSVANAVVDAVIDGVAGRVPVYVGVGSAGTTRTLDTMTRLVRPGVSYVVASGPFYYPVESQESLAVHFEAVAEASDVPILLYNIPQNTGSTITGGTAARLAEHPHIVGIKDSAGDMFAFQQFLCSRSDSFAVFQGREQLAAASAWLGADGIISAMANFAPAMLSTVFNAVRTNDKDKAIAAQQRVTELAELFDQGYWLGALKTALRETGLDVGDVVAPMTPCGPQQRRHIREYLESAGLNDEEVIVDG